MGRSRGSLAAAALVLGWMVLMVTGAVAPAPAVAQTWSRTDTGWNADRVRIEPAQGTAGVTVAGVGTYRGAVDITRTSRGLAVVNEVAFEDYVKGISEVSSAWPMEALKAQAIAARTYAVWEVGRDNATDYRAAGADICATQACQVYTGLAKERADNGARWVAAVEATKSQVLWWNNGPIVAKYSSSNGGEAVDGGRPYLRRFADPDDRYSPLHRWQVTVAPSQLAAAFGLAPRSVTAIQRVGDEILLTAKVDAYDAAEEPAHLNVDVLAFRDRINATIPAPESLPRTLPTVRFEPVLTTVDDAGTPAVVFSGRGWGHGIGMSQWGAYGKAVRGMKAPEILAAYYAGLRPVALPPTHIPATIRVAVALGTGAVNVSPGDVGGRLRVTTGAGDVLAHGDGGSWTIGPAQGGVAIRPPAEANGPAAVAVADGSPTAFAPGAPIEVRLHVADHALVTVRATAPGAADATPIGEPKVFAAGAIVVRVPPAQSPGTYSLTVDTDRGGGRVSSTTIPLTIGTVAGPPGQRTVAPKELAAAEPPGATARASATGTAAAAAAILTFMAVAAVTVRAVRAALGRRRAAPLHWSSPRNA